MVWDELIVGIANIKSEAAGRRRFGKVLPVQPSGLVLELARPSTFAAKTLKSASKPSHSGKELDEREGLAPFPRRESDLTFIFHGIVITISVI